MSADLNDEKKKRRFLSPEKKYQIFLEAQRSDVAVACQSAFNNDPLPACKIDPPRRIKS
jgi:hypothetical protein